MQITVKQAADYLMEKDDILILAHYNPDGDTIGSALALYHCLKRLGKRADVRCGDPIPAKYGYLIQALEPAEFSPACIVAVDVADPMLLGDALSLYADKVDLCIDHHISNTRYARMTVLDADACAAAQVVCQVVRQMGVEGDPDIANAIFTGLSTDTGCFQYANVTAECHRTAALMIEWGADHGMINKLMFGTKSRGRMAAEREILDTLEYHFDGRCAMVTIPYKIRERYGLERGELEGIASIPREIEGVEAGVTLRQIEEDVIRVSLRSGGKVNASEICVRMGGGGHPAAAGCTFRGTVEQARERVLAELEAAFSLI